MGTGGMTVGDSEESVLGKRERGEQKGESRKEEMGSRSLGKLTW